MNGVVQSDALRIAQQLEAPLFGLRASDIQQMADEAAIELRVQNSLLQDLMEALRGTVDLAWTEDSHAVNFDSTVLFGPYYDFSGVDGHLRQEFLGEIECIVWPSGSLGARKWSAYCTYDGSLWFEKFDTAQEAKEACMRLLDKVLPDHPAMKARAAIAKAQGEKA